MVTIEQVGARRTSDAAGDRRPVERRPVGRGPVVRPGARPVARDHRGPARPVPVRVRGGALCPAPVVAPAVSTPQALLRRVTAGVGLLVASAAAVVGLGLLSDIAAASAAPAPAPVVVQP